MAIESIDLFEPQVMAIINVTPDSFFASSRSFEERSIKESVERALKDGASVLDIGGYSSRPGADDVSLEQEWQRVALGLRAVREISHDAVVSIDTFRAEIIRRAYEEFGEVIVNDISGGCDDMYRVVGALSLPYILMHMRGTPQNMQNLTEYDDLVEDIKSYFTERATKLKEAGAQSIILDPGFGFAKSLEQNYTLLKHLDQITAMGYPTLAGVSRKSMIYKVLNTTPEESLIGTALLNWESLRAGATILRVHDVKEASDTIALFRHYTKK